MASFNTNAGSVAADLEGLAAGIGPKAAAVVQTYGFLLQAAVKRHATGRPGPNIITGHYNASIGLKISHSAGESSAQVGTNAVQGRRLEFGFHGTDSLGRRFQDPPLPHFGPALDEIEGPFSEAMEQLGIPRG